MQYKTMYCAGFAGYVLFVPYAHPLCQDITHGMATTYPNFCTVWHGLFQNVSDWMKKIVCAAQREKSTLGLTVCTFFLFHFLFLFSRTEL